MASFKTKQQQNLEDLEITRDEINQIGEALKKEEFRKLLHDYVDEITDPENQKIFEKEIIELEKERGNEVTFIHPSPGYVIKTSLDGEKKAFINICQNDKIEKPTAVPEAGGLRWSIPYSQTQPREDLDKKKNMCFVFDVVFHPDSLRMAQENNKFKDMVSNTAMDAIERNFNVTLDRKNVRYPKIAYKGYKHPSVIRRKSKNSTRSLSEDSDQGIFEIPNYPYPPLSEVNNVRKDVKPVSRPVEDYTTPKYLIKQRRNVDLQECTNSMTSKINAAIPDELVIEVELPLIKSASNVTLDVTEKSLKLVSESPAKYKLDITLPYAVDEDKGNAKFDSRLKKLTVTLVIKHYKRAPVLFELGREDSGVDSDMGSGFRSTESSSSEDEPVKCVEELSNVDIDKTSEKEDDSYRTNKSVSFLDDDKHYALPQYTCNMLDNVLALTFHVRNIEPESVDSKFLESDSGIHMKFSSLGSGFFPIHYSFCVKFPNNISVDNENFNVEVWDNNVIAQISLIGCDNEEDMEEYFVGVDEKSLEKITLPNPLKLSKVIENETDTSNLLPTSKCKVVKFAEDNVVLEIYNSCASLNDNDECNEETSDEKVVEKNVTETKADPEENRKDENVECDKFNNNNIGTKNETEEDKKVISKSLKSEYRLKTSPRSLTRTLSESQPEKSDQKVPCRGILKVCRSLSESSVDDYHWSSSSVENSDPSSNIQKIKKTVRFSDSISRKTFRSNSSILGQKKKNQRKSRNKKRAQERRASESENSEGEPDELKNHLERESSKSDEETSETQSDVSESDDGTKVEKPDVMSLSKRNPHKRGGKKSARKSANTAKMAFTNNLMFDLDM